LTYQAVVERHQRLGRFDFRSGYHRDTTESLKPEGVGHFGWS
jgi:hypothetical protein